MKRILRFTTLALILGVVLVYFLRYHTGHTLEQKIPIQATQVVQVNLRQLEKHMLWDVLSHPLKYIGTKKKKSRLLRSNLSKALNTLRIPKLVYFYTQADTSQWQSGPLKLTEHKPLASFLEKENFKKTVQGTGWIFSKQELHFYLADKTLVIGISKEPLKIATLFANASSAYADVKALWLQPLIDSKAAVVYVSRNQDQLQAFFTKGKMELKGSLAANFDVYQEQAMEVDPTDLLALNFRINTERDYGLINRFEQLKESFESYSHLSLDSIQPSLNGSVNFRMSSIETLQDTILTYAYDDDFNKVEQRSIQLLTVPNLSLKLGLLTKENAFNYLRRKNAIQQLEGEMIFTLNPLFKTRVYRNASQVEFRAGEVAKGKSHPYKLYASFWPHKYVEQPLELPLSAEIMDFFKSTKQIFVKIDGDNTIMGYVQSENPYRNYVAQLIRP